MLEPTIAADPVTIEGFQPMETFPKDGTRCDLLCQNRVVAKGIFWGQEIMGKKYVMRGDQNHLSLYLVPMGWRKTI